MAARLDWIGDPAASVPCAHRQLAAIAHVAGSIGFSFDLADVGDPDPVAAICDALNGWPAEELLLCARSRRATVSHPLDLAHRVRRSTALPVGVVRLGAGGGRRTGRTRLPLRSGHCTLEQPHPA